MVMPNGGRMVAVPEAFRTPSTYFQTALLKIREGRIEHIETITRPVFLGMDDGWTD